jgi:hypothetical protein
MAVFDQQESAVQADRQEADQRGHDEGRLGQDGAPARAAVRRHTRHRM